MASARTAPGRGVGAPTPAPGDVRQHLCDCQVDATAAKDLDRRARKSVCTLAFSFRRVVHGCARSSAAGIGFARRNCPKPPPTELPVSKQRVRVEAAGRLQEAPSQSMQQFCICRRQRPRHEDLWIHAPIQVAACVHHVRNTTGQASLEVSTAIAERVDTTSRYEFAAVSARAFDNDDATGVVHRQSLTGSADNLRVAQGVFAAAAPKVEARRWLVDSLTKQAAAPSPRAVVLQEGGRCAPKALPVRVVVRILKRSVSDALPRVARRGEHSRDVLRVARRRISLRRLWHGGAYGFGGRAI